MTETTKDMIAEIKFKDYSEQAKSTNYVLNNELTVEITLCEYRQLITQAATTDDRIRKAEDEKWQRNSENSKLKDANKELKAEINRYIIEFGKLPSEDEESEETGEYDYI